MTKRERLSFALRRLRTLAGQKNLALRVQGAHQIVKEVIDELSTGTKNDDIGSHVIALLEHMDAQNAENLEAEGVAVLHVMPDYAGQIREQIQALKALPCNNVRARHTETASIVRQTLSLFAQDANAEPMHAFLSVFDELTQEEQTLPPPLPDCSDQLRSHLDMLRSLEGSDDLEAADETAVAMLSEALALFAQGPNEVPIQDLLSAFEAFHQRVKTLPPPMPDYSAQLQSSIDALADLPHDDEHDAPWYTATNTLYHALATFAQGPNAEPIQTLLATVDALNMRAKPPAPSLPDHSAHIRKHIDTLASLDGLDDPDVVTAAAAIALYDTIAEFGEGPNEAPIRALLAMFDKVTGAE